MSRAPARHSRLALAQVLFTQGFGTRRECVARVLAGQVRVGGSLRDDPDEPFDTEGLCFEVEGREWPFRQPAVLMLHKPAGYECSTKPRHHPSVLSLLPLPLRVRGVQPVGRLDEDTTGLLLLTDDGGLIHRLTSPRHHVPKLYAVGCRHPVSAEQAQRLVAGVVLDDDPRPVSAASATITGEHTIDLELEQGKYHQVKRMLAAVGNRVETLHRHTVGALKLPPDLAPGQWRWVDAGQIWPAGQTPEGPAR